MPYLLSFMIMVCGSALLSAQLEELTVSRLDNEFTLEWKGLEDRTYFLQQSTNLEEWLYNGQIYTGSDQLISIGGMTNASKMFFRLHFTDLDDGGDPASADFDGDGLTTAEEIMTSPQTNPLNADTDGDLLLDGFEVNYGSNPNNSDSDANGVLDGHDDDDGDGATNEEEQNNGGDPNEPIDGGQSYLQATTGAQDEEVTATRDYTIPAGGSDYLVIAYLQSGEFPMFTEGSSEYNDTLSWEVTASNSEESFQETITVNEHHSSFQMAQAKEQSFAGYSPVSVQPLGIVSAEAEENVTVSVTIKVTNIADASYSSTAIVDLLPVELSPNLMPTSGVARAKFVLPAADKETMPIFAEEDLPTIKIANEACRNVHQDEIDPRVFYFTPPESPNGGAGNFDFELSGITVSNHPLLSNGDPLKLEGLVEYTDDASDGTKGFMDSNLVAWDEAKSFIDHTSEQGAISGDGANEIMGRYADRQATDQSGLAKVFFDGLALDQKILENYEKQLDDRIIEFEGDYPVSLPNASEYVFPTGMSIQALSDTAYEGGVAVIRFWRPISSGQPVVLSYEIGGSATEGSDYIKPSGAITIPANAQYADLELSIISDDLSDEKENITIVLKSGLGYNVAFFDKVEIELRDAVPTAAAFLKVNEVGDGVQQKSSSGPPQPRGPQFGPGFFTAAKALLSKTNRNKLLGTAVYTNPDGNRGLMNYAVFDANKLKLEVATNAASGQTIANILTAHPQAEIALNGALFNYKDLEPLITTGVVLRGGARLPTSTDSTKDSWKPAKARYWFGQTQDKDAAKNAGKAQSYQFGKGNPPEAGQIDRAMGGLISLIYPNGHAQTAQDDSDLGNYEAGWFTKPSGNIGKRIRGAAARLVPYNIIGIDRETGLLIVVSKKFREPILLKDAQQGLLVSGCDLALVTDGGGSVACWAKDWPHDGGYLSRERRQKGSPDKEETVTSYILFMPN